MRTSHQAVACRRDGWDPRPLKPWQWSREETIRLFAVGLAVECGREAIGISGAGKGELEARAWELKASIRFVL